MGRVIWRSPAGPDDPIYKEGLTISTPIWARAPKPPSKKSQGDTDTRPARGPRKPKTRK